MQTEDLVKKWDEAINRLGYPAERIAIMLRCLDPYGQHG